MTKQENYADKVTGEMTKQAEKAMAFVNLYQKQSEKIAAKWMEQNLAAAKEAQAFAKEWLDLGNKAGTEMMQAMTAGLKESTKVFTPAA